MIKIWYNFSIMTYNISRMKHNIKGCVNMEWLMDWFLENIIHNIVFYGFLVWLTIKAFY